MTLYALANGNRSRVIAVTDIRGDLVLGRDVEAMSPVRVRRDRVAGFFESQRLADRARRALGDVERLRRGRREKLLRELEKYEEETAHLRDMAVGNFAIPDGETEHAMARDC